LGLEFQGGPFSQPTTLQFDNIGLAQGHHDDTNNWWFAGHGAKQYGGPSGKDEAISLSDATGAYQVAFYRGSTCSTNPNKYSVLAGDCGTNPNTENNAHEVRIELLGN
jgi:hypothetical protein